MYIGEVRCIRRSEVSPWKHTTTLFLFLYIPKSYLEDAEVGCY